MLRRTLFVLAMMLPVSVHAATAIEPIESLVARDVKLRPELVGVHPRVFVTTQEIAALRERARTTHREHWQHVVATLPALASAPPGNDQVLDVRRAQNNVAHAIAGVSLAWAIERKPEMLAAAKRWTLAAIAYEPWGYTFSKPNVDLAAGHLLYAIGWSYDLLYDEWTPVERERIRRALERHARLVYQHFSPGPKEPGGAERKRFQYTQNHDYIPTAGLAVAALALMGESEEAPRWAALARAHHARTLELLSPDGCFYEGFEYWIFAAPWLVHFATAWEHATGESFWGAPLFANWKHYVAHTLLPDGQSAFDFGDVWEGPLTRAKKGQDYPRLYPGGTLQSNFNILWQVASKLRDPLTQAVADRLAGFGHTNLEEYWTLVYRDPALQAAQMTSLPLSHHFEDSGVFFHRTSWEKGATAIALRAGPPEGHRVAALLPLVPDWELESGHAHPDAGSVIVWAKGRYLIGDTGYAGVPFTRDHNTITIDGRGQGHEGDHNVWEDVPYGDLDAIRLKAETSGDTVRVVAECAAAYRPDVGVKRFTRTFVMRSPTEFELEDAIELAAAKPVSWHLHADEPFAVRERGFSLTAGAASVAGELAVPAAATIRTAVATVTAPGRPGLIEQGGHDPRGHQLTVDLPATTRVDVRCALRVR